MHLTKIKPGLNDLREYLYEAENARFGFSEHLENSRKAEYSKEIDELDASSIASLLETQRLNPAYLYFITDKENRHLSRQKYFTGVSDLNLEYDLVVFESYNSQVYYLFKGDGECLLGPCHDLDLGFGELIMFRNSGGRPEFNLVNLYDPDFHETGGIAPFDYFPYTRGISYLDGIESNYFKDPRIDMQKNNDPNYIIERVKKNGWSLQFASAELQNDEEIVAEACIRNSGALLFASARINRNKKFLAELLIKTRGQVFAYLSQEVQKAQEIQDSMEALEKEQLMKEKKQKEDSEEDGYLPF